MSATNPNSHATLFPSTHWSVVATARGTDTQAAEHAIDSLCATYWKPIYGYILYLGLSVEDAEDLTQEFFCQLMDRRNLFLEVRREKGKLRSYVCTAVKRLVQDAMRNRRRLKRGGGQQPIPLESVRELALAGNCVTPDKLFDQRWAVALIDRAFTELEADYLARGKEVLFHELRPFLELNQQDEPQGEIAERLGIRIGALRTSLTRMRQRLGVLFRRNVTESVEGGQVAVIEEIRYLVSLFVR